MSTTDPVDNDPSTPNATDDQDGRRGPWLRRTGAAALVLAVAAAGFAGGRLTNTDPEPVKATPAAARPSSPAPQTSAPSATASAASTPARTLGPQIFTGQDLDADHPATAPGWGLDATTLSSQDLLATFAAALGVPGEGTHASYGWTIGDSTTGAATLTVSEDLFASVSYYNPANTTYGCQESGSCAGLTTPSADDAIAAVRQALTAAGQDVTGWAFTTETYESTTDLIVNADRPDVPLGTGHWWTASVTSAGVATLYGYTATPTSLGELTLISPQEAVERLSDARFADSLRPGYDEEHAHADGEGDSDATGAVVAPAAPPAAGDPISWPTQVTVLTSWKLTTTQVITREGAIVILPAYEFSSADASTTWTVTAVSEDALSFSS